MDRSAPQPPSITDTALLFESLVTCPNCGASSTERMPANACVYFWDCPGCGASLTPKPGDCCVFCSYGSVPCPPVQQRRGCCD
jgi:hypothetical protein